MRANAHLNNFRTLTCLAIALIALFVSAIAMTVWGLRSDAIRDADNDTGNIAAVLSGQIARSIQSIDIILSDVRDQTGRQRSHSTKLWDEQLRTYEFYESLLAQLRRIPQADVIAVIDNTGHVANSTTQWPPTGTAVADRDYFQHLKNTQDDGLYISSLLKNRLSGQRTLFFAKRLNGPQREFLGVALIGLRLNFFESVYKSMTALRDRSFLLLHPDGTILVRYPDATDRANEKMPADSPWHRLVAEGGGNYRSPGYFDTHARYVSVRPLRDYPLVIDVAVEETAALANWRSRASLIGLGTLLAILCLAFLLYLLNKQFKRVIASEAALAKRESSLKEKSAELELANFQIDSALDNMPQGVLMFDADARLTLFNRRYVEMYGMHPDKVVVGCTLRDLVVHRHELGVIAVDVDAYCRNVIAQVARGKTTTRIIELNDGRSIHAVNNPLPGGGWIATHEDITERKRAQARLAQETSENRRMFETSLDLILVTDRVGNLLRVNPISYTILGYAPHEMIGRNAIEFIFPADLEVARAEMRLARSGRDICNFETRYVHKQGQMITLAWSGIWSESEQKHFFTGRDVTESKIAEKRFKYLAHFDQLTGLANRVSLQDDLNEAIASSDGPAGDATSIAIFDLDGFKDINDTLGHSFGDKLLQKVALRIAGIDAGNGRFYRLGGDEFVLVVPQCGDPLTIGRTVDTVLQGLAEKFDINGHQVFIGASAGIAIAPNDGADIEELMSSADLALYDAKAAGGNAQRFFVPTLRAKAQARRALDAELRRACVNKEFELFFQPQVRAGDGAIVGAEALLRWRHPEGGILTPAAFIDALGESPVALEVGRWILQAACEQAVAWRNKGFALRVGVNLFPAQFKGDILLNDVEAALAASGLPPHALELEITENIALGEHEETLAALHALRAKGVGLAFDDFGTGYASLSYLTRYPLTRLKIDQAFVRKIVDKSTQEDTAIVRSIIVMAHNLGLEVIAEGVETAAQASFLRAEKCEELQGYLYAKPLARGDFEAYLRLNQAGSAVPADSRLIG